MSHIYPREPVGGWSIGDRAYCVSAGRSRLEAGRVYRVNEVVQMRGFLGCGLRLAEIAPPPPNTGFWSSRFICLKRGHGSSLRQIEKARRYTMWHPGRDAAA